MDPLSDILSLLRPRSYRAGGFDAGDIAVRFPRHDGIKCYAVVSGACWLVVDGVAGALQVQEGGCFLLPRGRPFMLATDLTLPPVDAQTLMQGKVNGGISRHGGGGGCFIVGGHFALDGKYAESLLGALPPIVHLRAEADKAALRWCVERMMQELREPRPGGFLVVEHLAQMMLVQALRLHLAVAAPGRAGWLAALADPPLAAAMTAMHEEPARRWTLRALAQSAGMSRTSFALRFRAVVGATPMEYLTRWRMMLAGDRLVNSADAVAAIASSLGYESESAFAAAFKRVMGCSPRRYDRRLTSALPAARVPKAA